MAQPMPSISKTTSAPEHEETVEISGSNASSVSGRPSTDLGVVRVTPRRFWLLSIGLYLGLFLSMMDASIVASSLHSIAIEFEVLISANWVALAYAVAECSCAGVFARMSDIVGRRNAFVTAHVLFLGSSLGCGFSHNLTQLVVFRTFQGLGGSGLFALSTVFMPEVCPDHLLEYACGLASIVVVIALITGPIAGGILSQYASWRWIFWVNGPLSATAMAFCFAFWPRKQDIIHVPRRPWKSFDFAGSTLLIAGVGLVVFSLQNVGVSTTDIWAKAVFIAPIVVGAACWVALFVWVYNTDCRPCGYTVMSVLPLSLFRNRVYASGTLTTLFTGFPLFLLAFSLPLRAQIVSGKTSLDSATVLLPMLGAFAVGCVVSVACSVRRNYLFETMLAGSLLCVVGSGLLTTVSGPKDDNRLLGFITIVGLGIGLSISATTGLTGIEIAPQSYASAQGIIAQARLLGGSFGISASSIYWHNQITRLVHGPVPPQVAEFLSQDHGVLSSQLKLVVEQASSSAFRDSMVISTVMSGAAVLTALMGFNCEHQDTRQKRKDLVRAHMPPPTHSDCP
ncbi:hypothetical protein CDD82_7625 [Ophiocordyceps australis]|uniref:Major facilitator superfamily (MFS) profile domain-containing protein n=1 Tax=Ophiocordyceps australis TaxID=1399860 RepID=A0A2C5XUR9_9HYPO|nr:hypothetical protein CDD82_7625 [Ophiocordyceps australis]